MSTPDEGFDQSYSYANPAQARAAGMDVAMMYLSHTPAKNATPAKIVGYHKVGIAVLLGWETSADRALTGGVAGGASDGAEAAAQYDALIRAAGYAPRNKPAIAFAVDRDVSSRDWPAVDAYLTAAKHALAGRYLCGVYGEADLLDHTASHGISEMEFGTYAWSGGRISAYDDFHQYLNGQRMFGAEIDLDRVVHPTQVGAWWPPGSPYNVPDYNPEDDNMDQATFNKLMDGYWLTKDKDNQSGYARFFSRFAQRLRGDHAEAQDAAKKHQAAPETNTAASINHAVNDKGI